MLPTLESFGVISSQAKDHPSGAEPKPALLYRTPPGKLSLLVPSSESRRRNELIDCRAWSHPIPPRSFAKAAPGINVSSPEFTFLQLARDLSLIELIQVGYELCGRYSIDPSHPKGFSSRRNLTSADELIAYLETAQRAPGIRRALQAARYILDNSASPAETKLAIFLTLPTRYGGFGLPKPELNRTVITSTDHESRLGTRRCDLVWKHANLALEYESDAEHALSHKIYADSVRRNELTAEGVTVITVTKRQLYNLIELRKIVEQISPLLADRYRIRAKDHASRQHQLYGQLLAS